MLSGITAGKPLSQQLSINVASQLLLSSNDKSLSDNEIKNNVGGSILGLLGGESTNNLLERGLSKSPISRFIHF